MKSKKLEEKNKFTDQELKIRRKHKAELFICLIYASIIQLFFVSLNANHMIASIETFNMYAKISYLAQILIAVLMFEVAYRKEKKALAITGIEFVLLAIHTLLVARNVTLLIGNKEGYILSTSYIWPIYYCLKALIIHTKENRRRLKQISDISEIVKEEKPTKKVAKKRKT